MRVAVRFLVRGLMSLALGLPVTAQILQPVIPVQLDGEPRLTQLPPFALLGNGQCDSSGVLYLNYATPAGASFSSAVARIGPDGDTENLSLSDLPGSSGEQHTFAFAAADDGSLHEIVRTANFEPEHNSPQIDYVRFDPDGAIRSHAAFAQQFVPSVLLPLPNGNFFAAGAALQGAADDTVAETALAGIFDSDARLQRNVQRQSDPASAGKKQHSQDGNDEALQGQTARLGDDGNIYLLLNGEHAKIAVITQSGRIERMLNPKEPFENGVVSNMWVSGGRLLMVYEGETDDPKDAFVYVMYDARTGEVIRVYHPEFSGTPACFEDGQTLSVLVRKPSSGTIGIATVELR